MSNKTKKPNSLTPVNKPKTKREYVRVSNVIELCNIIKGHGDKVAFSYFDSSREVKDLTYAQLYRRITRTAAGLTEKGYAGKRIAILGETSIDWITSYFAILAIGGVAIPMDKELDISSIVGLLGSVDTDALIYSASFNGKFADVQKSGVEIKSFLPMAPDENEIGDNVTPLKAVRDLGRIAVANGYQLPEVENREGLAEMLFTSGTTGTSKCVMLSQKNIFSTVTSACETVLFTPNDRIVSVLPIHHTYELACMLAALDYGIHICINDSLTRVLKNFKLFKPTGLVLVPLFVYTIYKRIWAEAKKTGRDKILKIGIGASQALMGVKIDVRNKIFAEIRENFGGELEKIICGGAALNPKMIAFFETIGISIYEGFGITECSPLVCVTPYYARKYGSVGPAVPCCQIRIDGENENDFGYIEGEIQVRGDNVMLGYYKNEEATKAVFTDDYWFRTGDMGYIDEDGYLYITGRLKSVIVLENGKNIFPEEIEEYLADIKTIAESVVVGRAHGEVVDLVAIVYPDYTKFPEGTSEEAILADIESSVNHLNKTLPSHKHIKKVEIRSVEFEKTSSRKIKRFLVK